MSTTEATEKLRRLADRNGDGKVSFADVRFELDKINAKIDATKYEKHKVFFAGFVTGFGLVMIFLLV